MAASTGERLAPAALVRVAAGRRGQLWDGSTLLLLTTPAFFDHDGRASPSTGLWEVGLRREGRFLAEFVARTRFGHRGGPLRATQILPHVAAATLAVGGVFGGEVASLQVINEVQVDAEWEGGAWGSEATQRLAAVLVGGRGRLAANLDRTFSGDANTRLEEAGQLTGHLRAAQLPTSWTVGGDAMMEWEAQELGFEAERSWGLGGFVETKSRPITAKIEADVLPGEHLELTAHLRLRW